MTALTNFPILETSSLKACPNLYQLSGQALEVAGTWFHQLFHSPEVDIHDAVGHLPPVPGRTRRSTDCELLPVRPVRTHRKADMAERSRRQSSLLQVSL